ncbi:MAG: septum formation initiator family protein [Elusimicrobiota bacterium]|jgi:cell division protein FtsB
MSLRWARERWLPLAAGAALLLLLVNGGFRRLVRQSLELRSLRRETAALKKEEAELRGQVTAATGDDRELERSARKELGYLKPGEVEYRFPPPERRK